MANFTKLRSLGRQCALTAYAEITFADFASGESLEGAAAADTVELFGIPKDAEVVGVWLNVKELFVGAADMTVAVSDAVKGSAYVAATDVDATGGSLGEVASALDTISYTASDSIIVTLAGADLTALTAGKVSVQADYIQRNRSNEVHE